MSQASTPIKRMNSHVLHSAMLNYGVTPGGAFQFMRGLPIASQEDRVALCAILLGLTRAGHPSMDCRKAGGEQGELLLYALMDIILGSY
jgi:hypothetical protein